MSKFDIFDKSAFNEIKKDNANIIKVFEYRDAFFNYKIKLKNIKSINLYFDKKKGVVVTAPKTANDADIRNFLKRNYLKITDSMNTVDVEMIRRYVIPVEVCGGANIAVLNKRYRIVVKKTHGEGVNSVEHCCINKEDLIIYTDKDPRDYENNKKILRFWYGREILNALNGKEINNIEYDFILDKLHG